ncbi:MAG TPA: ABC transporter permease [Firmicutes bacterium]|nr:ABC transporter permease [Bacillota bacterium]
MNLLKFIAKRVLIFIPQLFAVLLVTFLLIRLIPGSPAEAMAGSFATDEVVAAIEEKMGLDKSLTTQFVMYVEDLFHGDMGTSWYTSNPVTKDIAQRFPATLELITYSLLLAVIIGVFFGLATSFRPNSIGARLGKGYSLLAGAMPEFWIALLLIFAFYVTWDIAPAPLGRISLSISPPKTITGMYTIDALLTGNMRAFKSAASQLVLPVVTLGLCYSGPIMKMTRTIMSDVVNANYVWYARACGLPTKKVNRYVIRNGLTPVVTFIGVQYGYLFGAATLIEQIFGWGGIGQYAVSAVTNKDYAAIQGFMLVAALFCMIIYLVVDIIYYIIDPRSRA